MQTIINSEMNTKTNMLTPNEMQFPDAFLTLGEFPREFKRKWYRHFDPLFMTILIGTFIVQTGILILLLSWIRNTEPDNLTALHQKYARLLLENYTVNEFGLNNFEKDKATFLYGVVDKAEQASQFSENQGNQSTNSRGKQRSKSTSRFSSGQGTGNNTDDSFSSGGLAGSGSNSSDGELSDQVASQGLLQYIIASEGENGVNAELQEIFKQGERNARFLEGSLSHVKLTSYRKAEDNESDANAKGNFGRAKGAKSSVSAEEVRSSFTPIEKANITTVAKNTELETSTVSALEKSGKKMTARKPDSITRIVLSHNQAIQDCYKQALKKEPNLKGKVVIRLSITPDGGVDQVQILETTIDYEPMLTCMTNRIRRWTDFGESDPTLGVLSYRQTYVFGY